MKWVVLKQPQPFTSSADSKGISKGPPFPSRRHILFRKLRRTMDILSLPFFFSEVWPWTTRMIASLNSDAFRGAEELLELFVVLNIYSLRTMERTNQLTNHLRSARRKGHIAQFVSQKQTG